MRTTRMIPTLAVVAGALSLAACGGDPDATGDAAAGKDAKRKDAVLRYARCMRENGVEMPDPKTNENGVLVIEGKQKGPDPQKDSGFEAADDACRKHLEAALPPKMDEAQQKKFRDEALQHAKCMREQGIDFPDPRIGEGGQVSVEIGGESGIDPSSPKFQAAQKKCGSALGPGEPGE